MTTLHLKNGLIFDGHHPDLIADRNVLIEDGRIVAITDSEPDRSVDREIDLAGRVIMPGLIDCHFHAYATDVNLALLESLPITYIAQRTRHIMENALRRGFTTVRDAGGGDYGLWRAIEDGTLAGPRLFYCGRAFSQTGGHVDPRPVHEGSCGCSLRGNLGLVIDGVEPLRKAVRENLRQGAHHVKIMVSGGVASPTDPIEGLQYSEDEILAVVDEAVRHRSYVMAHAYTPESITRSVKAGVRSIEHANLIDFEAASLVAQRGAFVVPTLVTYDAFSRYASQIGAPRTTMEKLAIVREKGLEAVEICMNAGVKLGLGTDLIGDLHCHQVKELALRSEVNTAFEVLHSATAINAEIIQRGDELGCVRPGALADLLIVDGNPLEDLSILYAKDNAIDYVIKAGRPVVTLK